MIIETLVILGSFFDLILTYNYLKIYKEKFPKKDYAVIEANPLVRAFIKSKGLKEGMVYSGMIILFVLAGLLYVLPTAWKYFLLGVYYMMVTFHWSNFIALKYMKGGLKNGKTKKNN